jgi:hypothetical protein
MILQKLFDDKVTLAISTLADGNMRAFSDGEFEQVLENQGKLAIALGLTADKTARVLTTYVNRKSFTEYFEINDKSLSEHTIEKSESDLLCADGLVATSSDCALLLPLADCLGVVVYDVEQNILGLLHSGRQNLEEDGAFKFVEFLKENYGCRPENLRVYFSPHAQNFEIFALNNAKLAEAAEEQLVRAGVRAENIERSDIDTVTNPDFPSNSAGDKTTRFAVAVRLNTVQ